MKEGMNECNSLPSGVDEINWNTAKRNFSGMYKLNVISGVADLLKDSKRIFWYYILIKITEFMSGNFMQALKWSSIIKWNRRKEKFD
jgi:hypothetical protein